MPENPIRRRNPVALSPLLRKGGVHQRCRSSERRQQNDVLRDLLDEWELEKMESDEDEGMDGIL
jgi:hypothetical protein